jgi:hypothetical protein
MIRRSMLIAAGAAVMAFGLVAGADARMVGSPAPQADSGTAYFAITHAAHGTEFADGDISDQILGTGVVSYSLKLGGNAKVVKVTAKKVVFYTSTGSISGTATATITTVAKTQKITDGKLMLDKGFGSLKADSLTATFSGTADLATNMYVFTYKGRVSE